MRAYCTLASFLEASHASLPLAPQGLCPPIYFPDSTARYTEARCPCEVASWPRMHLVTSSVPTSQGTAPLEMPRDNSLMGAGRQPIQSGSHSSQGRKASPVMRHLELMHLQTTHTHRINKQTRTPCRCPERPVHKVSLLQGVIAGCREGPGWPPSQPSPAALTLPAPQASHPCSTTSSFTT